MRSIWWMLNVENEVGPRWYIEAKKTCNMWGFPLVERYEMKLYKLINSKGDNLDKGQGTLGYVYYFTSM